MSVHVCVFFFNKTFFHLQFIVTILYRAECEYWIERQNENGSKEEMEKNGIEASYYPFITNKKQICHFRVE